MSSRVQVVQAVQTSSLILPRDAGEETGGDLNHLNFLNDWNHKVVGTGIGRDRRDFLLGRNFCEYAIVL